MLRKVELQRKYSNMQSQVNSCLVEIRSVEEQLEFVRSKKSELKVIKGDLQSNLDQARLVDFSISLVEWRGSNYSDFHDMFVSSLCNDKYKNFIKDVDNNLDALVSEERRLENKLLENRGLIGSLRQGLNWITSEIEKIVN